VDKVIIELIGQLKDSFHWYLDLIVILVLAGYGFTAGSYVFTWVIFNKLMRNHLKHIKSRLKDLDGKD
jgi:hypothetical protein